MKKVLLIALSAFLFSGVAMAQDSTKTKKECGDHKKACCKKGEKKACCKKGEKKECDHKKEEKKGE